MLPVKQKVKSCPKASFYKLWCNGSLISIIHFTSLYCPSCFLCNNLQVDEGSQVTLTSDDIIVADPDSSLNDLIIDIETQPGFGVIKDIAPGEKINLSYNFVFVVGIALARTFM